MILFKKGDKRYIHINKNVGHDRRSNMPKKERALLSTTFFLLLLVEKVSGVRASNNT